MSTRHKAVGIHVFAGGFTAGVKRVMDVECQLETFNLGLRTVEERLKLPFIQRPNADWPEVEAQMAFGNPRCTAFSCITSQCGENAHGAFAKQTRDIIELSQYAAGRYDIIIFESVQQAFSTGRPLLDYIIEEFYDKHNYRYAHILQNAASFNNSQWRKRYFFVAYRDDRNFNITPPVIGHEYKTLWDEIYSKVPNTKARGVPLKADEYDPDCYIQMTKDEWECIPHLPNGWGINQLAEFDYEKLPPHYRMMWDRRTSNMPFSLHCCYRLNWFRPSPTLHSSSSRFIHPDEHRPLTIGELSKIMGWEHIPAGTLSVPQIVKGICPNVGEWLAEQAVAYLDNHWGSEDWESTYNANTGTWEGRDTTGEKEKVFNLTSYHGQHFDISRFPSDLVQRYRFNVDPDTGRPIRPWSKIRKQSGDDARATGLVGKAGESVRQPSAEPA